MPTLPTLCIKARSHGAIFVNVTAIKEKGFVDVNETVHMVQLRCICVCDVMHGMGSIPILCNCHVQFQYI